MKSTTCIIQARRQSTRLPDKILKLLGDKSVLQHVVERCQKIEGVKHVIVAAPTGRFEDKVEEEAQLLGVQTFRGSMNDVLSRYYGAASLTDCDYIMRVTADCPLLDPEICSRLIKKTVAENADYSGIGGWPHGLDCEVFKRTALELANKHAISAMDREHVTLWMKRQESLTKTFLTSGNNSLHTDNRWVVDYPEDYQFLTKLFSFFPNGVPPLSWEEVLNIIDDNPNLRNINNAQALEWAKKNIKIYKDGEISDD